MEKLLFAANGLALTLESTVATGAGHLRTINFNAYTGSTITLGSAALVAMTEIRNADGSNTLALRDNGDVTLNGGLAFTSDAPANAILSTLQYHGAQTVSMSLIQFGNITNITGTAAAETLAFSGAGNVNLNTHALTGVDTLSFAAGVSGLNIHAGTLRNAGTNNTIALQGLGSGDVVTVNKDTTNFDALDSGSVAGIGDWHYDNAAKTLAYWDMSVNNVVTLAGVQGNVTSDGNSLVLTLA